MKKNCHNCVNLEYYEGNEYDGEGPNGFFCAKRQANMTQDQESKFTTRLESERFRKAPKRCFEPRPVVSNKENKD